MALALWLTLAFSHAPAQTTPAAQDLNAKSLPLRTALHHDPTLSSSLERLIALYRQAGRIDELVGLYRDHISRYPADRSGRTVYVRLLAATNSPESLRAARAAVGQFPQDAFLRFVLHQILRDRRDAEALTQLDEAIQLQARPDRKAAWIDELLPMAIEEERRDLAEKHLGTLAAEAASPQQQLQVAKRMNSHQFHQLALDLIQKKTAASASPETMVELELEAAAAEVGLKQSEAAASRLEKLLSKVTADYWRRGEIVKRRLQLVNTQGARDALINSAREAVRKNPRDEAAVIDLARILIDLQLRREALDVLINAGNSFPGSGQIEKQTLELLDRLRDFHRRESFLAQRLKRQPDRPDLTLLHLKTLYLLGRSQEALEKLNEAARGLPPREQITYYLETARFLRRSLLADHASELFRRVVELDPSRLDVRRELAETYLAMGQRHRVRTLFSDLGTEQANLENLMDLVQFMVEEGLLADARNAVRRRLEQDSKNLDLRLTLLNIEMRLGNYQVGQQLIASSRELADTAARYLRWLEAAVAFHEDFGSVEAFFSAEPARLTSDPEGSTQRRLERRLALAEVAARGGREKQAAEMLKSEISEDLPAERQITLRRQLVAILEKDARQAAAVLTELEQLIQDDPRHVDEYRARLALLHSRNQRDDLAAGLLSEIDVERIHDAELLNELAPLYRRDVEHRRRALTILRRLTVLNPSDRSNWEKWIASLAASGDETGLRNSLRQLLAGVAELPIDQDTRAALEAHIADSYWRDISQCLAAGDESRLAAGLAYLDSVESVVSNDQQWLWMTWIRAYLLSRLGNQPAFQEALADLERVAQSLHATPVDSAGQPSESPPAEQLAASLRIAFPDGISISLEHARRLLADSSTPTSSPQLASRQGPSPEFQVRWTYSVAPRAVTCIVPLNDSCTLICDDQGEGHCLDAISGKLLWRKPALTRTQMSMSGQFNATSAAQWQQIQLAQSMISTMPVSQQAAARMQLQSQTLSLMSQYARTANPLADNSERFYVPGPAEVNCYGVSDGRLLWRAEIGAVGASREASSNMNQRPDACLFRYGEQLVTYDPLSGTVTKIDPVTGKVVWDRRYASAEPVAYSIGWHNSGASLAGRRLLVYGVRTAIIDLGGGDVEWSFDPWRVRSFPVELKDPDAEESSTSDGASFAAPLTGYPGAANAFGQRPTRYVSHLDASAPAEPSSAKTSLSAPAVVWAAKLQDATPRRAILHERGLLLFDQTGMQRINTKVPLAGQRVATRGQLVGVAGHKVCFQQGPLLQFVDILTGAVKEFDLREIAEGPAASPLRIAIDGFWVYATGPGGILGINAIAGRRAFREDWPAEIALNQKVSEAAAMTSPTPPRFLNAPPRPTAPYQGYYTGSAVPQPTYPAATTTAASTTGIDQPQINCVDRGVLYATPTSNQVAALQTRVLRKADPNAGAAFRPATRRPTAVSRPPSAQPASASTPDADG